MNSGQIIDKAIEKVGDGIRNILDSHHIEHGIGTDEDDQIAIIQINLLSDLKKLRVSIHEEFVEQLKSLAKRPQQKLD
jgi:hypothetical protein